MLFQLFNKIYGSALILKQLPAQRKIAFSSLENIHKERDRRLRDIVHYAAHNVPYYQEMFRNNKIDYRDIRTAADLDKLPLITKKMLREDPDRFISTSKQGKKSVPFITSGTTGTPLRIHHDIDSIVSNVAHCEPEKQIVRQYLGDIKKSKQVSILASGSTIRTIWDVYTNYTFFKSPVKRNILAIEKTFSELIENINERKPDIISGYGSQLEALFKYATVHDIKIHQSKILNYGADGMTDAGKELLIDKFNLNIFSRYSSVECFRIGYTCKYDKGFHIHENLCDLKIVGADGRRLPDGESGEVVISNLVNKGTVLLNYKLGDIATRSQQQCTCGRNHPLLTDLVGRIEDFINLPDGNMVHPRVIWNIFKKIKGIVRYQLIQHDHTKFELKLVTIERSVYQQLIPQIINTLLSILGDVEINSAYYEQLDASSAGKFRPVVSHCSKT